MRTALTEIVAPLAARLDQVNVSFDAGRALEVVDNVDEGYVWPDVIVEGPTEPSPFLLVSAPGAMGKSAAARALAAHLRVPYIDLARMRVGTASLTGELTKSLGFAAASEFAERLKQGTTALVLDGTDEAQLVSGRESFVEFISDLAWLLADAAAFGQVILLGRRDATELTQLAFDELGYIPPRVELAPLSPGQAAELVDLTLDRRRLGPGEVYNVHRLHPVPFGELRDAIFTDLAVALDPGASRDEWGDASNFVGYPPVVVAVAQRMAVDNPAAELAALRGSKSSYERSKRGDLLIQIVESILDREMAKVQSRLGDRLAMRPDDVSRRSLYTRDEQVARLLHFTGTQGIELDAPAQLSPHERSIYEEHVASFLQDHPFLLERAFANAVFSDYVRAWATTSPISELYAKRREAFLGSLPRVGPFYVHFVHALSMGPTAAIPESLVSDLITSHHLGVRDGFVFYGQTPDMARLDLTESFGDPAGTLEFEVTELSGALALQTPLARISIVTDCGVILRGQGGKIELGPEVGIFASEIVLEGDSLGAIARKGQNMSVLLIAEAAEHSPDFKVSVYPEPSGLALSWANPWHQWKPYQLDVGDFRASVNPRTFARASLGLRRIIGSFRQSMGDHPSVSADKMDRIIVAASPVFVAVLEALQELGVVARQTGLYALHLGELGKYGVTYAGLRGPNPSLVLRDLLTAVMQSDAFKKASFPD